MNGGARVQTISDQDRMVDASSECCMVVMGIDYELNHEDTNHDGKGADGINHDGKGIDWIDHNLMIDLISTLTI